MPGTAATVSQHDGPVTVFLGEEGVGADAQQFGEAEGEFIRKASRHMVDGGFGDLLLRQGPVVRSENSIDHLQVLSGRRLWLGETNDGYPRTGPRVGELDASAQLTSKSLNDPGAQTWLDRLGSAGHADAVVGHAEDPAIASGVVIDDDVAVSVVGKGVLQPVDDQLGDDQTQAYGHAG